MKRNTFVAALTAAIVSAVLSVSVSHALTPGVTTVNNSTTLTPASLSQLQTALTQEEQATATATAGQLTSLTNLVTSLSTQLKGLTTTVNGLAPVVHSIAEREYAICYNDDQGNGYPDGLATNTTAADFLAPCYAGFYRRIPYFNADDLYSAPAPKG